MKENELHIAAQYAVIRLYPAAYREQYLDDINTSFDAPEIAYVFQYLSLGLTGVFTSLIANFIYDKLKSPVPRNDASIQELLEEQERKLDELREIIESGESRYPYANLPPHKISDKDRELAKYHEMQLLKIKESDPSIRDIVEDAVQQLESRGAQALAEEIDDFAET